MPDIPVTDIVTIERSKRKQWIFERLLSRWSPARISEVLKERHNELVPIGDIEQFKATIPEIMRLESSALAERFKKLDVKIDEMGEQQRVLALLRERLDAALTLETVTKGNVDQAEATRLENLIIKRAKAYQLELNRYAKLRNQIGELGPQHIQVEHKLLAPQWTLQEIMDGKHKIVDVTPKQIEGGTDG